jgi:hypothetical protein
LLEAGFDDIISLGSLQLATPTFASYAVATLICSLISLRYAGHAQRRVTGQRTRRAAAAQAAVQQAKLLRYLPQTVQQQQQQQQQQQGALSSNGLAAPVGTMRPSATVATAHGGEDGKEDEVAMLVHAMLAARFISWQAAAYVGYIFTSNLFTSFSAGLLLQLFNSWACGRTAEAEQSSTNLRPKMDIK